MIATVDDEEQTHTGGGVFVMYNCARLAMLLSQFHKHVKEGIQLAHLLALCVKMDPFGRSPLSFA